MRPFILSSGRCLCHGSHPNAVESLGVFRNNFYIVKNLDFVFEIFSYSAIWNRFYVFNAIILFSGQSTGIVGLVGPTLLCKR